jgi:hypothetical protein
MPIPAMLVLLHRPEEQRLAAARFFPSLHDVVLPQKYLVFQAGLPHHSMDVRVLRA